MQPITLFRVQVGFCLATEIQLRDSLIHIYIERKLKKY